MLRCGEIIPYRGVDMFLTELDIALIHADLGKVVLSEPDPALLEKLLADSERALRYAALSRTMAAGCLNARVGAS